MTDREKLIKLLENSPSLSAVDYRGYEWGADFLLSHGVTFATSEIDFDYEGED